MWNCLRTSAKSESVAGPGFSSIAFLWEFERWGRLVYKRTQSIHAFPPKMLKTHLVRDIPEEISLFGNAPHKGGLKRCPFFHDFLDLFLWRLNILYSQWWQVRDEKHTSVNRFFSAKSFSSWSIYGGCKSTAKDCMKTTGLTCSCWNCTLSISYSQLEYKQM